MTDLTKTIVQKASGETRLNPDEQRYYMGTFRERVILTIAFEEATDAAFLSSFGAVCQQVANKCQPVKLKISPRLSAFLQISCIKIAQKYGIAVSIIDEASGTSPFALLFHTDHAIDCEAISLQEQFPNLLNQPPQKEPEKKGFWKKLFG